MKYIYPTVFTKLDDGSYMAYVPDLQINTQGESLTEALDMARDAISLICIDLEDDGKELPAPSMFQDHSDNELVSYVDVDLDAYRKAMARRTVRRNVSLPSWLDTAAKEANVNVSAILVKALKAELDLDQY